MYVLCVNMLSLNKGINKYCKLKYESVFSIIISDLGPNENKQKLDREGEVFEG